MFKKIVLPAFLFFCITACNNTDTGSNTYDELLAQMPFKPLTDSIKTFKDDAGLYFRRAVLLNEKNHYLPALQDFNASWQLKPDTLTAYAISTLLLENKPEQALDFLAASEKKGIWNTGLWLNRANAYERTGNLKEALNICTQALQADSNSADALMYKADLLEKLNSPLPDRTPLLERAALLNPQSKEVLVKLAYHYAELKNNKAVVIADVLIKNLAADDQADAWYIKGVYFENTGNVKAALDNFNTAIQKNYNYLNAYIEKGNIYLDTKNYAEAKKVFELLITVSPAFPDGWYGLGQYFEKTGNKEEARLNYEKAYGLDKSFTQANEALQRLK